MSIAATSPLTTRIQSVLDERSMLKHPFYRAWTAGTLPLDSMRAYARQYYHFEAAFPRLLSAIHTRTDSPAIRQMLLDNLWDEEHGERNHPRLWLDFANALGVSDGDVTGAPLNSQTRALVHHYDHMARNAPLGEALATLFAYEGQVPTIAWQKIKGLSEHYGFAPAQFEFFSVHLVADIAHAGHEMEAIDIASEDDDRVVAATETACDLLLGFLDGCMEEAA